MHFLWHNTRVSRDPPRRSDEVGPSFSFRIVGWAAPAELPPDRGDIERIERRKGQGRLRPSDQPGSEGGVAACGGRKGVGARPAAQRPAALAHSAHLPTAQLPPSLPHPLPPSSTRLRSMTAPSSS